ncbi:PhzF family phenazine biosynthesis protein [Paenibacillus sp. HN-1]|uniref:PhzF family phenazine biosynthesis protein n=1 Tax=Paenibacillus TaxID=44249 RepID=UPI001CA920FE|nr:MULTISPECIES: PhzF family phenazine biosynthesis protein [Paenibacillus]MBY9077066.1 PhzF family phenazine biosynthesis protein [Paenibacillus sp. CGMCC 1.18879]MBY9086561.1 PhzF family phenazine biosynthesis protein [Paenibacillus sinensis]
MTLPIYIVDAFTEQAFGGNPAAVCLLQTPAPEAYMSQVAAEMNLSETAFLWPENGGGYRLRWFTPAAEVELCGHATLASAHTLWESGALPADKRAEFHTLSGLLTAEQSGEGITLSFPAYELSPAEPITGLVSALGLQEEDVEELWHYADNLIVTVSDESRVRSMNPDFTALTTLPPRAVAVTARGLEDGIDFVSRFFAPSIGVNEDPVTGSAHTALASFWSGRLSRRELTAYQASSRGGLLRLRVTDDRIYLTGRAVTVISGQLHAAP